MQLIDKICSVIIAVMGVLMLHSTLYNIPGFFCRARRWPATDKKYRYAVVIAARNEERVIGNLIASIRAQTYQGVLDIIVVADNCTDNTAALCRSLGASVYERHDESRQRKGYALEFLFSALEKDHAISYYDGFFIFDADNLLAPDFVERMNEAFASGEKIVTSYRNTKNFDTNAISSAYGIHFYQNSMSKHRPRSILGLGTHLTGTGYLISSELLAGGWHYVTFTEDDQITMVMSGRGHKVAYVEAAEFFDEQPTGFRTVFRQRVRWAKGRLTNFFKYGGKAFAGIFRYKSFTCYDMFTHYFPYGLITWVIGTIYPLCSLVYGLFHPGTYDYSAMASNILTAFGTQYLYSLVFGALTVLREHKHIRCSGGKLTLYVFTYPWFNMISVPVYIAAIFMHVRWKPIVHDDTRTIDELL